MMARLMGLATISPRELSGLVEADRAAVFDVNPRSSWERAHVPGARHLDPEGFERDELPSNTDAELIFYCSNPWCRKAPLAARRARDMGFQGIRVMSAGIKGWLDAGLPTEPGA